MAIDLGPLTGFYGFVPTFHDAHLMSITVDGTRVEGQFYLYEKPADGMPKQDWDEDLHVLAALEWQGVSRLETHFEDNSLDSVSFSLENGRVVTALNRAWVSPPGIVIAYSVRVSQCEWATARFEGLEGRDINQFWLNIAVGDLTREAGSRH